CTWRERIAPGTSATKTTTSPIMSTLTSSDFGELKRPTTRVHAPPGGGSNWSFGDDTAPAAPQKKRGGVVNSPPQAPAPAPAAVPPPAPIVAAPVAAPAPVAVHTGQLRVAIIKTKADAEVVDAMTRNCVDKLALNQHVVADTFAVPSLDDLAYAANKLAQQGGFHAVICFGFLNVADPLFPALSHCLTQSFIDVGVKNVKPIVRALFVGEPRTASVKVNGGWGSEFADNIEDLIRIGGFVSAPVQHNAPATANGAAHSSKSVVKISKGNVVPQRVSNAPRSVAHTLDLLRSSLYEHGAKGIAGLGRKFRVIDDDNNNQLSRSEFSKAIREHALDLTDSEVDELFQFIDADNSGGINFDEFLVAVRGELNERRTQMVLAAFKVLDADGNGIIELNDIMQKYSADKHPEVLSGKKTKDQVLRDFLDTFDGGEKDGKVHPNEFVRYYANVSASIDDDDYFELMIRNAWHISGGEGWCQNTTCRRVLVTHADGSQTVEEIMNDIGIEASNLQAMHANLQAQGINAQDINRTGYVENKNDANKRANESFQPKYVKKKQTGAGESSIVFG
ncbi:TPA: hypothetical protein N0F65_000112, partial [Lagenidium giganteum]